MTPESRFDTRNLASIDGQILLSLADGPCNAGEIYSSVNASQPTVSRRLASLLEAGIIDVRQTPDDRRFSVYSLNFSAIRNCISREQVIGFVKLAAIIGQALSPDDMDPAPELPNNGPKLLLCNEGSENDPVSSEESPRALESSVRLRSSAA